MTILIVSVGGAAVLFCWLMGLIVRHERRRTRLGTAFGPETKGLADIREAGRSARTVREVGALHPPRAR